jgi:hypothetical protein
MVVARVVNADAQVDGLALNLGPSTPPERILLLLHDQLGKVSKLAFDETLEAPDGWPNLHVAFRQYPKAAFRMPDTHRQRSQHALSAGHEHDGIGQDG